MIDRMLGALLDFIRSYGRVANVHIPNEPLTRCHKGYAFAATSVQLTEAAISSQFSTISSDDVGGLQAEMFSR